ncbi:MAG: SulP family inorganic anion transporter [Hyphomicrobiales bacterium]|nr:SulP family inorganic anion transporter [Hyphomicrobiales bacterium]
MTVVISRSDVWSRLIGPTLGDAMAGGLTGVVTVTFALAYAALMFSGPLLPQLGVGLGVTLIGTMVVATIVGLRGSLPFAAAGPDSSSVVVIAVMGSDLAARHSPEVAARHFIVLTVLSTLVSGMVLFALGTLRLGRAVRYTPFPVIAGFMSTIGLLIIASALALANGAPVRLSDWSTVVSAAQNPHLIAGLGFGLIMLIATRLWNGASTTPLLVLVAIIVAHLVRIATGITVEEARASGWLFSGVGEIAFVNPLRHISALAIDWQIIGNNLGYIGVVSLATTLVVLLNETGLEAATGRDIDVDHELRWHGAANLAAGFAGGLVGNISIGRTMLNYQCGARTRLSVFTMVGVLALFVAFSRLVGYLPPFILGGVLLSLGASITQEWLMRSRAKLSHLDYGLVILTAAIGVLGSISFAVAAGLALSCLLFVLACAYSPVICKDYLHPAHGDGRLSPTVQEANSRPESGRLLRIIELQGFIFFGNANRLTERVRQCLMGRGLAVGGALVLDFTRVIGLDSAAVFALSRIQQLIAAAGADLAFVVPTRELAHALKQGGVLGETVPSFQELAHAFEFYEELASVDPAPAIRGERNFVGQLTTKIGVADATAPLLSHPRRREREPFDVSSPGSDERSTSHSTPI